MMIKNRIRLWRLLVFSLFAFGPSVLTAQEIDPNDVIRVNTDLVVLDAQVIDRKTRRVFGPLRKDDFVILEENVKQEIAYFGQDQLPLSIVLLLELSGSVRPVIQGSAATFQRLPCYTDSRPCFSKGRRQTLFPRTQADTSD
jgi:hypothetical protein